MVLYVARIRRPLALAPVLPKPLLPTNPFAVWRPPPDPTKRSDPHATASPLYASKTYQTELPRGAQRQLASPPRPPQCWGGRRRDPTHQQSRRAGAFTSMGAAAAGGAELRRHRGASRREPHLDRCDCGLRGRGSLAGRTIGPAFWARSIFPCRTPCTLGANLCCRKTPGKKKSKKTIRKPSGHFARSPHSKCDNF